MKPGICYCLKASRCFCFCFLLWPSQTCHLLLHPLWMWLCGRPLLRVRLSVTHLRTMYPSNKYICYPFVQFIELSEVSGPARPQIGPVRWEMERELSGPPSLPHHCREGISIRPDRLRKGYRWLMGNSTEANKRYWHRIKSSCSTGNQCQIWLVEHLCCVCAAVRPALSWFFLCICTYKMAFQLKKNIDCAQWYFASVKLSDTVKQIFTFPTEPG